MVNRPPKACDEEFDAGLERIEAFRSARRTVPRRRPSGRRLRSFRRERCGGVGRLFAGGEGAGAALDEIGEVGSGAFGDRELVAQVLERWSHRFWKKPVVQDSTAIRITPTNAAHLPLK